MFLNENVAPEYIGEQIECEAYVESSEAALINIVAESQIELQNLKISMLKLEHAAVVNEDAKLLEAGIGDYWKKFVAMVKRVWEAIKKWFKQKWDWLMGLIQGVDGFLKKYEGKLKGLKFDPFKREIWGQVDYEKGLNTVATWANSAANADAPDEAGKKPGTVDNVTSGTAGSGKVDGYKKALLAKVGGKNDGDFVSAFKKAIRGEEKKETEINSGLITYYLGVLHANKSYPQRLNAMKKAVDANYAAAIADAEAEMRNTKGDAKKHNNRAAAKKAVGDVVSSAAAALVAMHAESVSEALSVCRGALSGEGKEDAKKAKEDAKKTAKEEKPAEAAPAKAEDSVLAAFGFED